MKKIILAVFCLLALVPMANAQCYGHRTYYTYPNTYQYPVREVIVNEVVREVITPVAVPVLVPAYQYQYVAPCAAPVATAPAVVGQAPAMQQSAIGVQQSDLRALAKALLAEMRQADGGPDNGPPMVANGQSPLNAISVFANRCASCHTGQSAKGGVQIFTAPGQFNPGVDLQRLMRAVEDGRMPPQAVNDPSFRLSPQEMAALRRGF